MSAYLCSSDEINVIVAGLQAANSVNADILPEPLQFDSPSDFGVTLYAMNRNAVEQRYPDTIGNPDNLPGEVDAEGHHKPYKYSYREVTSMSEFIHTLGSYLYQCSEGDVMDLPLYQALKVFKQALETAEKQQKARAEVEYQKERNTTEHISATETAKMIRARLAETFPGVKFWVKTDQYAGGASIDINWIDGPTAKQVKQITDSYSGAGFDGMNDYKTSNDAWLLPDGRVIFAEYERAMGESEKTAKPHPEAKRVHFGADYIFENRHYSPKAKDIINKVCAEYGEQEPTYFEYEYKKGVTVIDWDCTKLSADWDRAQMINRAIREALDTHADNWQQSKPATVREIAQANPDRVIICKPTPAQQPARVAKPRKQATQEDPEPVKKTRPSSAPYGMKF